MSVLSWWRSWHGAPTDHKWAVIAARSGVLTGVVSAVAWALMDYASQQKDRGSVVGFDTEEYAIFSGFAEAEIEAVIKAMEDKGFIVDGRLTNWEKRQPKREDDSRDRVRKSREMKRNVTQCNAEASTVTPQIKSTDTENRLTENRLTDTEKDRGREEATDGDPFDVFQHVLEGRGILLTGVKDIESVNEMLEFGATKEDLEAGITWKADNNAGKPVRYVSQVIGPTRTAMQKRLQSNGHSSETFAVGEGGRVTL